MHKRFVSLLSTMFFVFAIALSCGDEETGGDEGDGVTIVIGAGNTFVTPDVTAVSEATITIINNSSNPHTITSQSAEDAFDNTGVFDVVVPSDGVNTLTLPTAAVGTIYSYYCRFYEDVMNPSSGTITIE